MSNYRKVCVLGNCAVLLFLSSILIVNILTAQKSNGSEATGSDGQALIIHLRLSDNNAGTPEERKKIFELEDRMINVIDKSGAGEYDGNEIGGGEFTMYVYGRSAERLWGIVAPVLKTFGPRAGSYLIKRYGKPGAKQERVLLMAPSDPSAR